MWNTTTSNRFGNNGKKYVDHAPQGFSRFVGFRITKAFHKVTIAEYFLNIYYLFKTLLPRPWVCTLGSQFTMNSSIF